jgi:predicted SprT family Zn-dependent metalloprotease
MLDLRELEGILQDRFAQHLEALGSEAPPHRVEFSRRITTSWALIYYRRHLVRLSPYLFLLEPHELKHGAHWAELDATLRHEAAHAHMFHTAGETGHSAGFHEVLARLGVRANGLCDLGPENTAFRYVYGCDVCGSTWPRRAPLRGNWSCGSCAPGRYSHEHRLVLRAQLDPWRLLSVRRDVVEDVMRDGLAALRQGPAPRPLVRMIDASISAPAFAAPLVP